MNSFPSLYLRYWKSLDRVAFPKFALRTMFCEAFSGFGGEQRLGILYRAIIPTSF